MELMQKRLKMHVIRLLEDLQVEAVWQ